MEEKDMPPMYIDSRMTSVHVTSDRSKGVKSPELTDEQIKHSLEPLKDGYGKSEE